MAILSLSGIVSGMEVTCNEKGKSNGAEKRTGKWLGTEHIQYARHAPSQHCASATMVGRQGTTSPHAPNMNDVETQMTLITDRVSATSALQPICQFTLPI